MPKSKQYAGMKLPQIVQNPMGVWIRNKFAGMRLHKNTNISDIQHLNKNAGKSTHTSPVVRTAENDGHKNPARLRAMKTKAYHITKL